MFTEANKAIGFTSIITLAIIAFFVSLTCFTIVDVGQRGVYVSMGYMSENLRQEGFHLKAPWATIHKVEVKQITVIGKTECFSKDLQTVKVTYSCMYAIPQEKVLTLFQKYSGDPFESLVKPRIEEAIKLAASTLTAESIVKQREAVKAVALGEIKKQLEGLIVVSDLPITNIDLTDLLEKAIEGKQVAEQKALAKEYELQSANKDAEISIAKAKGEAEAIRITGEALAKSPTVTLMEAVKKWDGHAPQSLVLPNNGVFPVVPVSK
jgi:prohibitin 2